MVVGFFEPFFWILEGVGQKLYAGIVFWTVCCILCTGRLFLSVHRSRSWFSCVLCRMCMAKGIYLGGNLGYEIWDIEFFLGWGHSVCV